MLLPLVVACGSDPAAPRPDPVVPEGLWTASSLPSAILRLAPAQLGDSGAPRTPATTVTTPSARLSALIGLAFDNSGTMWVASQTDSLLLAFAPEALSGAGDQTATRVISATARSLAGPTSLAFDSQGRLWVANAAGGTLVRYDRAQLAAGGSPAPAVVLNVNGVGHPLSLAFDAAGSLWMSDVPSHTVSKLTEAQLAASGSPTPAVVLSVTDSSQFEPAGIAFDSQGNLWIANVASANLLSYSAAQLAVSGSPAPHVVLTTNFGSLSVPVGLAFDSEGNLWVVGYAGSLTKLARASLGASGAPAAKARIDLTGHALLWNAAFWPKPAGLPLR